MAVWRMHLDIEPPYLVIKPDMTEADFYRLADEDSNRGKLSSAVLRGFWIDVAWLWRKQLPSTVACLRTILA
jgi:hypothetical protein